MCFTERKTWNFILKFREIFLWRETVLRAHGMESDEKPFFCQINAFAWGKMVHVVIDTYFSLFQKGLKIFLNPRLSLIVPLSHIPVQSWHQIRPELTKSNYCGCPIRLPPFPEFARYFSYFGIQGLPSALFNPWNCLVPLSYNILIPSLHQIRLPSGNEKIKPCFTGRTNPFFPFWKIFFFLFLLLPKSCKISCFMTKIFKILAENIWK